MQPEAFSARINELLDRGVRPEDDEQLRAAAIESSRYREALAAQQRLFEGLEADEIPELPDDFAQRVVVQVMQYESPLAPQVAPSSRRRSWLFELAAVAVLVLVVIAGWSSFDTSSKVARSTNSRSDQIATVPDSSSEQAPALAHGVHETSTPPLVVKPEVNHVRYDDLYQAILNRLPDRTAQDELLAHRPEWVDEVATGLRPVATSLGGAINTLRSTLPSSSKRDRADEPQAGLEISLSRYLV